MSSVATPAPPPASPAPPTQRALVQRLLRLVWQYRWGCLGVLALQFCLLTMALAGLSFTGLGIDVIRHAVALEHGAAPGVAPKPPVWPLGLAPPADWGAMRVIIGIAGLILGLALLRALLNYHYTVAITKLVQARVVVDLRSQVYDKMQRLSFRFFDGNASGSIINRVTSDVQNVRAFVDQVMVQGVILLVSLTIYLAYMTRIHVGLTLACLATTPLLWLATVRFSRIVRPAFLLNRELFDRLVLAISENLQGAHVVKGFARHREEIEKFRVANTAVHDQKFSVFHTISVFQPLIGFLTQINLVVLLAYGGWLVIRHEQAPDAATAAAVGMSVGQLIIFSGLLQQFSGQVANISNIANGMQQSLTAAQRVFEVLDAPVEIAPPSSPVQVGRLRGHVQFEGVRFGYRGGQDVLNGIDLDVPAGKCVALVGATGAGKSSLLSLVPRFYDPREGRVRVDGVDLRELDLRDLRRQIGIVFQESFLFSNTIAANIAFGAPDATQEQIERAARVASAHDFIRAMPNGYETVLAEGGNSLSGGQRQRLAIARAVLLEPPILLLDDPTAAIDPQTEDEILLAMDNAIRGRTTFLVAHRMSTLKRADFIVVLAGGRVVQVGSHAELMDRGGVYSRAAQFQAPDEESVRLLHDGERA